MKNLEYLRHKMQPLVEKFVPKQAIIGLIKQELKLNGYKKSEREDFARTLFTELCRNLKKNRKWQTALETIYQGKYPLKVKEFYYGGQLAVFGNTPKARSKNETYSTKKINLLAKPTNAQVSQVAPLLVDIVESKNGTMIKGNVETDRFKVFEADAVTKSSLVQVEIRNRPMVGVNTHWVFQNGYLPLWVIPAKMKVTDVDEPLIKEFLEDMRTSFAWKSEDSLATYLCCLIQPMLIHLKPGMFPSYLFRGPSNSGKGFLSAVLPRWFYASNIEYPVFQRKFPKDTYEFTVGMAAAKDSLFYSFDEIKNITDEQLKDFDHIATASELTYRQMREGIFKVPNYLTFTMTSVYVNLTDETWGRLGLIELTEPRTKQIERFLEKWQNRAPRLLRAIFSVLTTWHNSNPKYSLIGGRRPGFGTIADACDIVFEIRPTFEGQSSVNDLLEAICALESNKDIGDCSGKRKRLSRKQILNQLKEQHAVNYTPGEIMLRLKTSLGGSGERIYQSQDGLDYKISLKEEGNEKRVFIYVKKLRVKTTVSTEIDT